MVSDVCRVQHLKLELADGYRSLGYITIIHTILTPYSPHLSSLDITFFYQPEIPVTKNLSWHLLLSCKTSSVGGTNRKFNLHAEKHN